MRCRAPEAGRLTCCIFCCPPERLFPFGKGSTFESAFRLLFSLASYSANQMLPCLWWHLPADALGLVLFFFTMNVVRVANPLSRVALAALPLNGPCHGFCDKSYAVSLSRAPASLRLPGSLFDCGVRRPPGPAGAKYRDWAGPGCAGTLRTRPDQATTRRPGPFTTRQPGHATGWPPGRATAQQPG
jgi:hypothetical protein